MLLFTTATVITINTLYILFYIVLLPNLDTMRADIWDELKALVFGLGNAGSSLHTKNQLRVQENPNTWNWSLMHISDEMESSRPVEGIFRDKS